MKRKDPVFAESPFLFGDSGHINISVLRSSGSISMTPSQLTKLQNLLTNPVVLLMLIAPENHDDVLEMTDVEASTDLSKDAERAM